MTRDRDCRLDFPFILVGKAGNHTARHSDSLAIERGMHCGKWTEGRADIHPPFWRRDCPYVRQVAARWLDPELGP
jgi:hypothetical protein